MTRRLLITASAAGLGIFVIYYTAVLTLVTAPNSQSTVLRGSRTTIPIPAREAADRPSPKRTIDGQLDPEFLRMHQELLEREKTTQIDLLFLGDSIIYRWSREGRSSWEKSFSQYRVGNFAVGGERTQHLLWQIENGLLDHVQPRVIVLGIGTNNTDYPAADIIVAVKQVVSIIQKKVTGCRLLLLGILPRDWPADESWKKINVVNSELAKLDNGRSILFIDPAPAFLNAKGTIAIELMPDLLHPSASGYQALTNYVSPTIDRLMK